MEIYVVTTDKCLDFDHDFDNYKVESSYYVSAEKAIKVFKKLVKNK